MIRFINLTGQILIDDDEPHFAWYDTIIDVFMSFNHSQEWHTWEEFEEDLMIYLKEHRSSLHIPGKIPHDDEFYKKREIKIVIRFEKLYQFKNHPTNSDLSSKE